MFISKLLAFLVLLVCSVAKPVVAEIVYPTKPIRIIVPFTPGGSPDILARTIGQKITEATGVTVVVENIAGAGGTIGADRAAKALPDGYTLLMGHVGTLAVAPSVYPHLPYDPLKSFTPVAWVARVPNVMAVHPSVPVKNVYELVNYLKTNPGKVNYGSGGNGSAAHLATEYFKLVTQTFIVHVPYRGTAPSVTDAVAGQIQMVFTGAPAIIPMVRSGKLKAIAVSSPKRMESMPDIPTLAESGVKGLEGFEADQWYGIVAPVGTSSEIVKKLNHVINASLTMPEMTARLKAEGATAMPTTPDVFGQLIQNEIKRWRPVVSNAKISAD
ncbi:MAG: tripartite tricarboxylate transporter substrate binding protein [Burkholderiales bacterium]|jgi:tripartite-type tricarboxylate transporter receptor subunit TctC|nr:tripartite tricarboxylate transporter substrate binding protein [Burkholderiales bacterium]